MHRAVLVLVLVHCACVTQEGRRCREERCCDVERGNMRMVPPTCIGDGCCENGPCLSGKGLLH